MSIEELSEQCGISKDLIETLEKDFVQIQSEDILTVFRLSRTLGCTMEDLVEI